MNWRPILGLLSLIYGAFCIYIGAKKPEKIWQMKKIQMFVKMLKEKGAVIFFIIWGLAFVGLAIWLFI